MPCPTVEAAFDRAHALATLGLPRIVVNIDPVVKWNPAWGELEAGRRFMSTPRSPRGSIQGKHLLALRYAAL